MREIKFGNKIRKFCKAIISNTYSNSVTTFFKEIEEFQKLAVKISESEYVNYEKYFNKHMTHELNLVRIELKKIELKHKDSVHRTSRKIEEFEAKLADDELNQDMSNFYRKEYLNILKPMYYLEQMLENFKNYNEVLNKVKEEFSEWFFYGRIDFLKQILQAYIITDETSRKEEIWIFRKYSKQLTKKRLERMYQQAGLELE